MDPETKSDPTIEMLLDKIQAMESDLAKAKEENAMLSKKMDNVIALNRSLLKHEPSTVQEDKTKEDVLTLYLKKKGI